MKTFQNVDKSIAMNTPHNHRVPRLLRYHPVPRSTVILTVIGTMFFTAMLVLSGALLIYFDIKRGTPRFPTTGLTILAFAAIATAFNVYSLILIYRRNRQVVQAYPDHVAIRDSETAEPLKLFYKDIKRLRANRFGFTLIFSLFKRYSFGPILDRADYILEAIYKSRKDLLTEDQYRLLHSKVVQLDHRIKRSREAFSLRQFQILALVISGIGAFALVLTQAQTVKMSWQAELLRAWAQLWAILAFLQILAYFVVNRLSVYEWNQRKKENPNEKRRNMVFEERLNHYAKPATMILFMVSALFYSLHAGNMIAWGPSENAIAEIGIKKHENLFYDRRYNCTNCRFAVKAGDHVIIAPNKQNVLDLTLARIVAIEYPNRMLAGATEQQTTTPTSPVLRVILEERNGSEIEIGESQIIGKFVF